MARFNENVLSIEDMTKQFIDAAFNNLRSAEGGDFSLFFSVFS